ncbi:2-desacetyl-2-hydroxyethyl bacteriochlorophyllide A dehydrogenase [Kribbella sp. VKM Ac-2527]|uniref:2-desacetyl-2-hydroxyethyl bacteriochlorophyllide A dehydrogenase n=1 Tax=Kribbella caucasensis TaxID=2512215 RepID=A0A4R6KHF1_9ACTN|nr:alcohol dehydrogenase catalytic domain-containing protein [Kribbella sp. VKM Ac-2527]TDO50139.1 2-desacetyl-2-hydroxyethyl bacteriochlorophyllide A dehydrogenase [Kribbella sp. VKM Ac-2527]
MAAQLSLGNRQITRILRSSSGRFEQISGIVPDVNSAAHRQAVLIGPNDLRVRTQTGGTPGAGELLITPDAVGVCGTDLELLAGTMGYLTDGGATYPIVPGHEWTGVVDSVGPGVNGFAIGDRVVGECSIGCGVCGVCAAGRYHLCPDRTETGILNRAGGMASTLVFPARAAHRLPPSVDPLDAALIEPLAVAYRGLHRLPAAPIGPIAIVGAGTIGLLCALAARAIGMGPVLLVEHHAARRRFSAGLGFDAVATVPHRFSQVIDATGTPSGTAAAVQGTADGGTIVVLGLCGRPSVPVDLDSLVLRDLAMVGSLGSPGVWPEVIDLVATGRVLPSTIVSHEFALDEATDAFTRARDADPATRKVVVRPQRSAASRQAASLQAATDPERPGTASW